MRAVSRLLLLPSCLAFTPRNLPHGRAGSRALCQLRYASPGRAASSNTRCPSPAASGAPTADISVAKTIFKEQRGNLDLVDTEKTLAEQGFPMAPEAMISSAQLFIEKKYGAEDTDLLAPEFQFIGPFIGPLTRDQYVDALGGSLNPEESFPDLTARQYGFTVDPTEAGRVWWFARPTGTFTGSAFMGAEADGRRIETAPQCFGVLLDEQGRVVKFNMGTPVDRTAGNSGGLGGLFAYLYFVGRPFPFRECKPYKQSFKMRAFLAIGNFLSKFSKKKEE